jgi:uncharacterized protein
VLLPAALALGLALGLVVGAIGGGGSVLAVPVLVLLLGRSVEEATTTSLLGVAAHLVAGHTLSPGVAGPMTAGCVAGAVAGAHAGGRLPQRALGRGFAGLCVLVAGLVLALALLGGADG